MSKKKLLIVTQDMEPYSALSQIANIANELPLYFQDNGMELRILMPKFGTINERRHRLHEVVRLSGMNIIVDDDDYPLIIKVASLPNSRLQVYFLDNDDFFKRKSVFTDADGIPFEDNPDRLVFFCKGVIETVKKFGWSPDIVHCLGWMTSLVPLYLKTAYVDDPVFKNSKVIYSLYDQEIPKLDKEKLLTKASINNLSHDEISSIFDENDVIIESAAIKYSDGLILGNETLPDDVSKLIADSGKKTLQLPAEDYLAALKSFYQDVMDAS
ncbi:MAG: glycogen/starch synthase [Saprospiraceae bacterium]|nr:glycogen/starch synthase [Saprospiraceae bacterium]